jgi:hypothetical protein
MRKRFGGGIASRVAGKAGDVALRARDALARPPRGIRVEEQPGPFGGEFDALDRRLAASCRVRGDRSAAYLEWRYGKGAIHAHETLRATRGGELAGFLVFRRCAPARLLVTEIESVDGDAARALVVELVARARPRGAESVEIQVLAGSPAARPLRGLGFLEREAGTAAVPFAAPGSRLGDALGSAANWWMVEGDRDA